jgi:hypothetical protein
VKTFYIEYEIPPMRGIFTEKIRTESEDKAKELFKLTHPKGKIRKIEGYYQHNL